MTLGVREVRRSDGPSLLQWRNHVRVRAMSINDAPISDDDHERWFQSLIAGDTSHVLIAMWDGVASGIVRLGELDAERRTASWNCHTSAATLTPGFGASLPVLGLGLGFGRFGLGEMHAEVLSANTNMRGVHRRLKLLETGIRQAAVARSDGTVADIHEYRVPASEWPDLRERSLRLMPPSIGPSLSAVLDELSNGS